MKRRSKTRPARAPGRQPASGLPRSLSFFIGLVGMLLCAGPPALVQAAGSEPPVAHRRAPKLFPDYAGIVIPPNLAPLNFKVEEPGTRYRVEMRSGRGDPIHLTSRSGSIRIPLKKWQTLLSANAGEALLWDVSVLDAQGRWSQFDTVTNRIAQEAIDGYLVYRLLKPLYSVYDHLGIYERALSSFAERPVLENRRFGGDCLNCHTFLNRRADTFALNIRTTAKTHPMLLVRSNQVTRVDRTMGYLSWHPSGRLLAFSANKFSLFFHTVGETRDVFDATSNLGLYRVDSNTFDFPPAIALTNRNETWPSWSPDGRHLYYCSAPPAPVERFRQIRYDLMRVSYDPDRDQWGEPELLVAAQQTGLSAAEPRVSPDGRLVLFCLSRYGHFPPYQPSTDLYLLDLQTRRPRRLEINSDQTDSWHCWSSNGRWVVFSSKRLDGLFARPFFSYVDEHGVFHKPFLLPQADPAFYDTYLKNFNAPELVLEPVKVTQDQLTKPLVKP